MREAQERVFSTSEGDQLFRVVQIPAKRASRFLVRFGKIVGPALGAAAEGDADLESMSGLGGALEKLFGQLTPDEFDWVASELMAPVSVVLNGIPVGVDVDLLFTGKIFEWYKLMFFSFEVSFGDFSGALADAYKKAEAAARAKSSISKTSGTPSSDT